MSRMDRLKRIWHTDNSSVALIRDVLVAVLAVFIILMILWTYTGLWFAAPMVAIESGSMEHHTPPFGRLGTIDAGDMVLFVKVTKASDIVPHGGPVQGAQAQNDWRTYGDYGDVVIYRPLNRTDVSQIIHRAMCWVDVSIKNGVRTYTIKDYGMYNVTTLTIPALGLMNQAPAWDHSGFLTKGDNNSIIDEISPICPQPVELGWISGKARMEIPWIGTINLFFNDLFHGTHTVNNVHEDSLICLGLVLAILISIPIILDVHDYLRKKKKEQEPREKIR